MLAKEAKFLADSYNDSTNLKRVDFLRLFDELDLEIRKASSKGAYSKTFDLSDVNLGQATPWPIFCFLKELDASEKHMLFRRIKERFIKNGFNASTLGSEIKIDWSV